MTQKSTSEILPGYVLRDRQSLKELLQTGLGFLGKTRLNHLLRCVEKPKNGLFNALLPHLYESEQRSYLGVFDKVKVPGRNHQFVERLVASQVSAVEYQEQGQFFCNALRFPEFAGTKVVRKNGREYPVEDWRPGPSERVVNPGLYVYTIEFDPPRTDVQAVLDKEIGWCLGGHDGTASGSRLDRIYNRLCQYQDFRLLEVVWSGNKSCHLHCLFDIRHLASTRFAGSRELAVNKMFPDIDDALLRPGFQSLWQPLVDLVSPILEVDLAPDLALKHPETLRRLPWGQRLVKETDALRFKAGSLVPQVVLYSKGRPYAREATMWFNDPEVFLKAVRPKRTKTHRTTPTKMLNEDDGEDFITSLAGLCERLWGDPRTNPRPSELLDDPDGFMVTFFNHAGDHNPSSIIKGDFRTLLVQGSPGPNPLPRYALPLSINELVEYWQREGHLIPERVLQEPSSWLEQGYFDLVEETPGSERTYLPNTIFSTAERHRLAAILTQEGVGKTTALLSNMPIEANPAGGSLVFAAASYRQAEEKCAEFNNDPTLHRDTWRGVLMPSFHHAYQEALQGASPVTPYEIVSLGCSSPLEAVYAKGGSVANHIEQVRQRFLDDRSKKGRSPILFTVHGVVQEWYRRGGTRLWLHPRFHEYLNLRRGGAIWKAEDLASEFYEHMAFQWVIYDEISTGDLMSNHPEDEVRWVWGLVKSLGGSWDDLSFADKVQAYDEGKAQNDLWTMTFDKCRAIIDAEYSERDIKEVDPTLEPFGVNNSPDSLYLSIKGKRFATKTKDWWIRNRCKFTVLTTERKPIAILQAIRERAINEDLNEPATKVKLVAFNSALANLGPDDPRPHLELPIYEDVFAITNLDTARLMPEETRVVMLARTTKARRGSNGASPDVIKLCKEIRHDEPQTVIITDIVKDIDVPGVITHKSARGSNEFANKPLAAIFMHLAPDQYRDLLLEDAQFGIRNAVKLHYLDMFDQDIGRTLGFRHGPGSQAIAYMSPRLWRQIGMTLLSESRYVIKL